MNRLLALAILMAVAALRGQETAGEGSATPQLDWRTVVPDYLSKGFLKGLDVDFKTFSNPDGGNSFGFHYKYDRTFRPVGESSSLNWIRLHPRVEGNVAFDSAANPEDFLTARLDVSGEYSGGGVIARKFTPEETVKYHALQRAAADIDTESQLEDFLAHDVNARWFASTLSPQLTMSLGLSAGIESDQRFVSRQGVFGAVATIDLDLWGDSARYNLFDYPFALVRHLTNSELAPRVDAMGSTFPQLIAGLDYVAPIDGDPRETAGATDDYWRLRAEVAMRSPIAYAAGQTLFFNCSYRVFYEISASPTVRAADLDLYQYGSVSISASSGMFVRYVSGSLPLDQRGNAFEVGWSYQL